LCGHGNAAANGKYYDEPFFNHAFVQLSRSSIGDYQIIGVYDGSRE